MSHKVLGIGLTLFALAVMFGCGGGGGGGTNTTATTGTTLTVKISPSKITLKPSGTTTFTATVSDGTGVTFTKSGGTLVANGNSANYTAPAVTGTYSVTATSTENKSAFQSAVVTVSGSTGGNTATVSGAVSDPAPINGVVVQFFNSAGTLVGSATTVNGQFNVSIPTTATKFSLLASSINTTQDYAEFFYKSGWYDPTISSCRAALPVLTGGESLTLSTITLDPTSAPPPPPPTCG